MSVHLRPTRRQHDRWRLAADAAAMDGADWRVHAANTVADATLPALHAVDSVAARGHDRVSDADEVGGEDAARTARRWHWSDATDARSRYPA